MKKCMYAFIGSMVFSFCVHAAPARPKVNADLMNSILQLTIKVIDLKIDNELFQDTLYEIYTLLNDSHFESEDKGVLLQRIKLILALLIEGEQFEDQNLDQVAITSPTK